MSDGQVRIEVVGFHGRKLPAQVPGAHLWVVLSMFQIEPTAGRFFLDRENLLTIEGPGCFWCELPWTEKVAANPCTGAP